MEYVVLTALKSDEIDHQNIMEYAVITASKSD